LKLNLYRYNNTADLPECQTILRNKTVFAVGYFMFIHTKKFVQNNKENLYILFEIQKNG